MDAVAVAVERLSPPDRRRTRWVYFEEIPKERRTASVYAWIHAHQERPEDALELRLLAENPPPGSGGWVKP